MFEKICLCGGTPRPVRALMAQERMFPDRPKQESQSVAWRFVEFKTEEGTFVKQKVRMAVEHAEQIQQLRKVSSVSVLRESPLLPSGKLSWLSHSDAQ